MNYPTTPYLHKAGSGPAPAKASPAQAQGGKLRAEKLGLGTSQLGLDQPSSSYRGRSPERESAEILSIAARAGIEVLDAQVSFGQAETTIGRIMPRPCPFKVMIKTGRCDRGADFVEDEARAALKRLRLDKADAIMVQSAGDLFGVHGQSVWDRLKLLRDEGLFRAIGVSCFASDDPVGLARRFKPDIVQAPVSLLDQRLIVNGALAEIAGLGVEVHLRSIFLQGLLFLPPDRMPTALKGASGPLSRVRRMIAEGRSDPLQAALGFALSRPEAASVIVGVASAAELQAVIAAAASPPPDLDWDEMALEDPAPLADNGWAAA
ncbi:MAG TPA: aldo/keto reductase [Caulobacteraceae bacterium]|nr:aldo/keto reductase [Caulobacteraceae bacterium]